MMQRRHLAIAALIAAALMPATACSRTGPEPPGGELRSSLVAPTLAGGEFDPTSLGDKVTMVMFWSPG